MNRHDVSSEKIGRFDFIFLSFEKTFSDVIGSQLVTQLGFFVFEENNNRKRNNG